MESAAVPATTLGRVTEQTTSSIYLPVDLLSSFQHQIEALSKKASRLALPPPSYVIDHNTYWAPVSSLVDTKLGLQAVFDTQALMQENQPLEKMIELHKVDLSATIAYMSGWNIVASLKHTVDPLDNNRPQVAVSVMPGKEWIARRYRDALPWCGHCETRRFRQTTFVLQHENKELMQVGSTCLKDFLGTKATTKLASWVAYWEELNALMTAKTYQPTSTTHKQYYQYHYPLPSMLALTAAITRTYGWVSRSQASSQTGLLATADHLAQYLEAETDDQKLAILPSGILPQDHLVAQDAITLATTTFSRPDLKLNDYLLNLKNLFANPTVSGHSYGLLASVIPWLQRQQQRQHDRLVLAASSHFVGTPGEKVELELTLTDIKGPFVYPSSWARSGESVSYLHRFTDSQGNVFTWFTSRSMDTINKGKVLKLKGTIKKHEERNGIKETALTRVRVQEPTLTIGA